MEQLTMKWYTREFIYSHLPVVVQSAIVAGYGRRIYRQRFGPGYEELAGFLERSERDNPDRRQEYQEKRLQALIRHAYRTVQYYRRVMDERGLTPGDISTGADLVKLPLLTKEDVRLAGDDLLSTSFSKRSLRAATTSATTGSPLTVLWDGSVALMNHACYMRVRRWAGLPFGRPYATLQGRLLTPLRQKKPPFWRDNPRWKQTFFSTMHMSEENLPHYVEKFRRAGIVHLEAYPSTAFVLARYLQATDDRLPLERVITTGEPLLPAHRALLEERFQAEAFDAYGQAERVVFSSECEEHDGHHLFDEYGITEFVSEDGSRVPDGSLGLLAGTSLHNFAMPLLRYVCGDVGSSSGGSCACGRTLPKLDGLTSRAGDIVVAPDGRMIPSIMLSWAVRWLSNVDRWQIRQDAADELRVLVVTRSELSEEEVDRVKGHFAKRMGPSMRVTVERVEEIPRTAIGKLRHVVSTVPLPLGGERPE